MISEWKNVILATKPPRWITNLSVWADVHDYQTDTCTLCLTSSLGYTPDIPYTGSWSLLPSWLTGRLCWNLGANQGQMPFL